MNDLKLVFRCLEDLAATTNFVDQIEAQSSSRAVRETSAYITTRSATAAQGAGKLITSDTMDSGEPIH